VWDELDTKIMTNTTIVANTSLMALLDRVDQGEEVTIERDGHAVALLVPTNSPECPESLQDHTLSTVDDQEFQQLCDAYASAV
jgi:antitoxin (DNA-binding transcriptional repressor) of toxin-antitoxin stability system